jgi:hypothetical protein
MSLHSQIEDTQWSTSAATQGIGKQYKFSDCHCVNCVRWTNTGDRERERERESYAPETTDMLSLLYIHVM